MPEHVHMLVSEPERAEFSVVLQMLKQNVARKLKLSPFWEARYYDFSVFSESKRIEKLKYMHRNPVKRGLVERPEDWLWSSFNYYSTGQEGIVKIEIEWERKSPPCLSKSGRDKGGAPS